MTSNSLPQSVRAFLMAAQGPEIFEPMDALRLLAAADLELLGFVEAFRGDDEAAWPAPEEIAGHAKRRAYVLVRCAELWSDLPGFREAAEAAVREFIAAEADVVSEAANLARLRQMGQAGADFFATFEAKKQAPGSGGIPGAC